MLKVLDPRAGLPRVRVNTAQRPESLQGKVIGLLDNGKINSDRVLSRLGDLLKREANVKDLILLSKTDATRPAPPKVIDDLAGRCDAVVVGVGD